MNRIYFKGDAANDEGTFEIIGDIGFQYEIKNCRTGRTSFIPKALITGPSRWLMWADWVAEKRVAYVAMLDAIKCVGPAREERLATFDANHA
jgi:hypothetical protein